MYDGAYKRFDEFHVNCTKHARQGTDLHSCLMIYSVNSQANSMLYLM